MRLFTPALLLGLLAFGCSQAQSSTPVGSTYDVEVQPVLQRACAPCHAGPTPNNLGLPVSGWPSFAGDAGTQDGGVSSGKARPAAGWSISSYLQTIACVAPSHASATLPANARAPILTALGSSTHPKVNLSEADRATLQAWVVAGAPAFQADVHDPGFADPRSSAFHGS
jgi:hypothetical protein